jgi:uncharacterized glyoxalase superfamily protein PhnB
LDLKKIVPHLFVNDVSRNIDYYRDVLGFKPIYTQKDEDVYNFAILKKGNVELMVGNKETLWKFDPELKGKKLFNSSVLYFEMDGVSSYYNEIKSRVEIIRDLRETWYKTREFWIKDLNGYLLAFFENL